MSSQVVQAGVGRAGMKDETPWLGFASLNIGISNMNRRLCGTPVQIVRVVSSEVVYTYSAGLRDIDENIDVMT